MVAFIAAAAQLGHKTQKTRGLQRDNHIRSGKGFGDKRKI